MSNNIIMEPMPQIGAYSFPSDLLTKDDGTAHTEEDIKPFCPYL